MTASVSLTRYVGCAGKTLIDDSVGQPNRDGVAGELERGNARDLSHIVWYWLY
jgi:hypothetical protein